jgi:hypothetical protein
MIHFCAVCGCCTRIDIVREHLEDTLRICDVSAKGLYGLIVNILYNRRKPESKFLFGSLSGPTDLATCRYDNDR